MNKAFLIRKGIMKDAMVLIPVLLLCFVILGAINFYSSAKVNTLEEEKKKLQDLEAEISTVVAQIEQTNKDSLIYKNISPDRFDTGDGYTSISARIKECKPILESLSEKYFVNILDLKIGNTEPYKVTSPTKIFTPI
jgi:hypothetical protein